ncbi:type II toxin-antitoxin system RelE/ParE family toxin [Chryseobacterium sp. MP_3.2]|uniref:type II toxin-antitoxin system RelE/ParE family toxin n=1 Tax=Chryseobacterium sp. MP_3.2 TaxID=3071712 RepID=UPI002DFEE0C1|nr:toxin ParE1/3/4 [Chryseobacterium sp. MP_3.2]
MFNYFLSVEAKEDLWIIYEYGSITFGAAQADKYFNMLNDCFDKIATNPLMFPIARQNSFYRFCVCGVDTIYYKLANEEIEIVTIIGRQNY